MIKLHKLIIKYFKILLFKMIPLSQETLWILTIAYDLSLVLILYRYFGKYGLYCSVILGILLGNLQGGKISELELFGYSFTASMGAILLAAGAKGKRYSLPNSRMMIHQPISGFQGQASDIDIHAKEVLKLRKQINNILANHTGKTEKQIAKDTDRDNFMDAQQSLDYGLIDEVLTDREEISK